MAIEMLQGAGAAFHSPVAFHPKPAGVTPEVPNQTQEAVKASAEAYETPAGGAGHKRQDPPDVIVSVSASMEITPVENFGTVVVKQTDSGQPMQYPAEQVVKAYTSLKAQLDATQASSAASAA